MVCVQHSTCHCPLPNAPHRKQTKHHTPHTTHHTQFVVVAWGDSPADLELIERVLTQLCSAHRNDGGCTVVVMTRRNKIEMEDTFKYVFVVVVVIVAWLCLLVVFVLYGCCVFIQPFLCLSNHSLLHVPHHTLLHVPHHTHSLTPTYTPHAHMNTHSKQIPETTRYGSRLIFREGNPLLVENLKQLNVSAAAAVVIVSDSGKYVYGCFIRGRGDCVGRGCFVGGGKYVRGCIECV